MLEAAMNIITFIRLSSRLILKSKQGKTVCALEIFLENLARIRQRESVHINGLIGDLTTCFCVSKPYVSKVIPITDFY
jgi:hypothetical protein